MSTSIARSNVLRIQRDIADLRKKDADEARREADLHASADRALSSAQNTSSASTRMSYLRQAERAQKDLARIAGKRADLAKGLSNKTTDLQRYEAQVRAEEERARKQSADRDRKAQIERDKQIRSLEAQLREQATALRKTPNVAKPPETVIEHDVFISHASEDKEPFVRGLAEKLATAGLVVWYDEFSLGWGDSLRRKIDQGLASSRFGVVVLSENFFKKEWPQRELDGLVQREISGHTRILPIWHKVSKDEVAQFSPTLADKLALNTSLLTVDEIVERLVAVRGAASDSA